MLYFFYTIFGDKMKIYIDMVLLLNFGFDLLLLFSVGIVLRRQTTLKKLFVGALIGAVTILSMFINMNSIMLFFIKVIISLFMVIFTYWFSILL